MAVNQSSKAQVQMMETMMVLLVFIVLLLVGLVFFWNFFSGDVAASAKSLKEERYTVLATVVPHLPELEYSERAIGKNYLDGSKLFSFKDTVEDHQAHYYGLFGPVSITIKQVYPEPLVKNKECTYNEFKQLDYPDNCDYWVLYDKLESKNVSSIVSMPLSLYFPEINQWRIANLNLRYVS